MTGGMQTICKIIYIFLAFVAIVLIGVGIFVGVARAESAVLPFTSAEDLRARVDSVLKANSQMVYQYRLDGTKFNIGDSAELISVVVVPDEAYEGITDAVAYIKYDSLGYPIALPAYRKAVVWWK